MKKLFYLALFLVASSAFAQSPQKITYQAVVRNSANALVSYTNVGMRISILQGSSTGTPVYVETQNQTTNVNGMATLQIGTGAVVSGSFSAINWGNGPYFVKTETDLNGGSNYTISGVTQFSSVPYALYALNGTAGTPGAPGATGPAGPAPSGTGIVTVNNGVLQTPQGINNGGVAYGANGNVATTASGTTGRVLTSNGTAAPTWNVPQTIVPLSGSTIQSIAPGSSTYVFIGGTTSITLTVPSRLTASGVAGIATAANTSTTFDAGICYQLPGGPIVNFVGSQFIILQSNGVRSGTSVSGSVVLQPGTYIVGFGVRNSGSTAMNNNDYVNGWVMVTPL